MGIVQEQRKKIENLEAKNRMLKRMYENQKMATAEARLAQEGAIQVIKCALVVAGGGIHFTREELEEAKKLDLVGRVHPDQSIEYYIPQLVEEDESEE